MGKNADKISKVVADTKARKKQLDRDVKAAYKNAVTYAVNILKNSATKSYTKAVDSFYTSYSPKSYGRREGLRNALVFDGPHINFQGSYSSGTLHISGSFLYSIDPELSTQFRNAYSQSIYDDDGTDFSYLLEGDDLFYQTFVLGWHGGAASGPEHPSPGTPYWRTGRGFTRWYRPAAMMSETPYMFFVEHVMSDEENIAIYKEAFYENLYAAWEKYMTGSE